jgi:[acyl-carrier-protein] S-malonyltransferase
MAGYLLLCPGQGMQHPAMLDFALSRAAGRDALAAAADAVGIDIVARVKAADALFEPIFAQIAIVASSVATWQALAGEVTAPALVAGYSVGEVSAWCCAGSWRVPQALELVSRRAQLMAQASPAGAAMMAVTAIREDALRPILERHSLHVAIEVDADHWVVAGRKVDLEAASAVLAAAGATPHPLPVGVPSHTPLLERAAEGLRRFLATFEGVDPAAPVLRGIDGRPAWTYPAARQALPDAVSHPIRWRACMDEALERGIGAALELPPGSALTRMLKARAAIECRSVADFRSVEGVARWLERAGEGRP